MDEVVSKMSSTIITKELNQPASEFECLYKNWGKPHNQEERRRELLDKQKFDRNNKVDTLRGILELVNGVDEENYFNEDVEKKTYYRPTIYVSGFSKVSNSYRNVLMLSEWLVEKPEDFHENWVVIACPKGVRMLVVACKGVTKCFTKIGRFQFSTQTALPGGNRFDKMSSCTVLDVFYQEKCNTMYVVDFLAWNNQPMTDCEMEFRHYWLQGQFTDNPAYGELSDRNKIKLVLLPKDSCTKENFNQFMMKWPAFGSTFPLVDGLLFYHKKAHYTSGPTPLVGWLYPFMVPEVLGADITVNQAYLDEKPDDYVDQSTYIKCFEEKLMKKYRRKNRFGSNKMDTSDDSKPETKKNEGKNEESTAEMDAEDIPKEDSSDVVVETDRT